MIETILQVGYIIHAADKQASANTKHTWATAHVCPRALQLAPTLPPPFLPPCTAARSPRAAANPIWPRTLALSVPKVQYGFLAPSVPKNCRTCMAPSTQSHHCSTVQRGVLCLCVRGPGTSRTSYVYTCGGSTAPPSPAIKQSWTFCMDASNFAPLRTNSCWKAFATLICWRLTRIFGKDAPSLNKA